MERLTEQGNCSKRIYIEQSPRGNLQMRNYRKRQEGQMAKRLPVCTGTFQMCGEFVQLFQQYIHRFAGHQAADGKWKQRDFRSGHDCKTPSSLRNRMNRGKNFLVGLSGCDNIVGVMGN